MVRVGGYTLIQFEDSEEGFLRHFDVTDLLHTFLTAFLFLEQFALTADITAVTLGEDIFADLLDGLAGNDLGSDSGLDSDVELLTRKEFFEFLTHATTEIDGIVAVGEGREGIDLLAVEEDIQFDEVGRSEAVHVPIEGGVALGDGFEFVVEIDDDLAERHVEEKLHAVAGDILLLDEFTTFAETECHDRTDVVGGGDDGRADIRLLNAVDLREIRHAGRVMYLDHAAVFGIDVVRDVRDGGDDIHIELAIQPLLDDLHVQETEESAAETKAQRHRRLRLEGERSIVELQFLQ